MLDGLLGPAWKAVGLAFNCTFLMFGSVIQLIACARSVLVPFLFCNLSFLLFQYLLKNAICYALIRVRYWGNHSNIYYIDDKFDKRTWTYIFGACCATTVFIPSFHNYRMWSFLGLGMTTYTAWYMTVASLVHGQVTKI